MGTRTSALGIVFACAVALRLALIVWSAYQDANFVVKYTDIDYFVYTDAARHVVAGRSPYERATYRYPPVLAALLIPNVLVHEAWGKVLFSVLDVVVGELIVKVGRRRGLSERALEYIACAWLFNPFTCTISTRGSCEALTGALMLMVLEGLTAGATVRAAIAYGTVVHFRLYPIIHAMTFLAFLNTDYVRNRPLFPGSRFRVISWLTVENIKFGVIAAATFLALTLVSYAAYGMEYIKEAMIYHLQRKDHRHNFASAFYGIYLDAHRDTNAPLSRVAEIAHVLASGPLPAIIVVTKLGISYAQDIPFALFVQTLAFVAFNKVVTAQYFVWWFMLLPLVIPAIVRSSRRNQVAFALFIWLIAQLHWLAWAYALEFEGAQVYERLWLASIAFFAANIWLIVNVVRSHVPEPFFSNGCLRKCKEA